MNDNAKKWVAALRSGKYKQTTGQLASGSGNARAYCCLGVACHLYRAEHSNFSWNGKHGDLPVRVREWLGLHSSDGDYAGSTLASKNDGGVSFTRIADIIESEPSGLFTEQP